MKLNRFNRLFWPLLLFPMLGVCYYPLNRYILLPKLGSGAPYTDLSGALVERYFSANQCALIACFLLAVATVTCGIYAAIHEAPRKARIAVIVFYFIYAAVASLLFLEFSLWS